MRRVSTRAWDPAWVGGLLLVVAGGCGLLADFFDPSLADRLGLDPAFLNPQQGTVIVAFNNTTRSPAAFSAYWSRDARDLTRHARNFGVDVPAGSVRNEVLECPVGQFSPGTLGADFSRSRGAVVVQTATGFETIDYPGPELTVGDGFACGDVIEVRLSAIGTGEAVTYSVSVRVIPGR